MKVKNLDKAIAEAERFLEIAKGFRQKARVFDNGPRLEHGANAAATRRVSMDLTKALSVLRRREE